MFLTPKRTASALATLALGLVAGCNDINPTQDQRTGRGNGDQLPVSGAASAGTNAYDSGVQAKGTPGSGKIIDGGVPPGVSTPYGGNDAGATPPVSTAKEGSDSGDSNSGRNAGKDGTIGADATTGKATPGKSNGGPESGSTPH